MIETEYEKIPHPSRDIEFKDDMKDFIIWWELFKEEIENNGSWIKEHKFDGWLLMLKQFLPKKTKIMGTAFLKDIVEIKDHRLLILLSHLYFENFINEIIRKRLNSSSKILDMSFSTKLEILRATKIFDDFYYSELRFINNLRNMYAHNLYFDVLNYNFDKSLAIKSLKVLDKYRSKRAKRKLCDFILRIYLIYLVLIFSKNFKETNFLDIMKETSEKNRNSISKAPS
ncbi:MAG: hypothetical protein MPEBLZ_00085 [Candidatus Methanoperedens nitroreducens]|uniref:Uncharacterized protein n=1 Tax=Candidatus Methanoperedens nitratireducens TaxID=1392998 RepID=A0A0P7ZJM2_9EURY|nr:hypothetical protein [Candidatus Methanoperedens sp. BLZ2]KAB2940620.1 MAG: hypothetical protein F9K14_19250 [Candidatus Methanoperedens sp.]KPQ45333.1 MAG: hypothetical protein MPEBLZ_00085 [Candidatus Methanoperedens sp. BLZ1]MBZ0177194.1 hypothetical protein [Candidatus Methanoperedens nitroreducens]MCX9079549.1 hypothetical protein [Candidatus Methanoperedens sp.]